MSDRLGDAKCACVVVCEYGAARTLSHGPPFGAHSSASVSTGRLAQKTPVGAGICAWIWLLVG